jgi:hypothetical protein
VVTPTREDLVDGTPVTLHLPLARLHLFNAETGRRLD